MTLTELTNSDQMLYLSCCLYVCTGFEALLKVIGITQLKDFKDLLTDTVPDRDIVTD